MAVIERGGFILMLFPSPGVVVRLSLLLLVLGLVFPSGTIAAAKTAAEVRASAVKELVLDIMSYTRWPVEPEVLRLCVVAPTEYAGALFSITGQSNGRAVSVNRYGVTDPAIRDHCDVLYLGVVDERTRLDLFSRLKGRAVLSISEQNAECSASAVFCLQPDPASERVRFDVNLDALALSGVRVHPAVLKLAKANRGAP